MAKKAIQDESKKTNKSHFHFACMSSRTPLLKLGDKSNDVYQLQTFLRSTGYLGKNCLPGTFCTFTVAALRHFQKCYGLDDSGEADKKTLALASRPRCGNPDLDSGSNSSGAAPFVLRGCKYNTTNLTYAFTNSTSDLTINRQQEILREAFNTWAAVTPITFTEVGPSNDPTFPIAFHRGDHGDGSAFDDGGSIQGNVLAHAFFPPPCGGIHSGAIHFDESEIWTDVAAPGKIRLLNVAIHEIGHLLGLSHSNVNDAIMFAFYDDDVDSLRNDDINGVQALYGSRPAGTTPIRGTLSSTGTSQVHRVNAQSGKMRVTLRGPANSDFDLYVRAGSAPTRTLFDARGFTGSSNEEVSLNVSGGDVFVMIDSWKGRGAYEVDIVFN